MEVFQDLIMNSRFPTASLFLPHLSLTPQPPGISSAHRENSRPCRWLVHTDAHTLTSSALSSGQDVTSSVRRSTPHDLTLSCASLHMFPTSQPRPPVIPILWISHLHALLILVPPLRKRPLPQALFSLPSPHLYSASLICPPGSV